MPYCHRFVFIAIAALSVGCASSGALRITMPSAVRLDASHSILFRVSSVVPDANESLGQLEKLTVSKLRSLFPNVRAASDPDTARADYVLNTRILNLDKVGGGTRFFFGGLAGRAGVVVDGELLDGKGGAKLATFVAEGKSSGGTIFAGTTDQALERTSEQIVLFVKSLYAGAPAPAAGAKSPGPKAANDPDSCEKGDADACFRAGAARHAAGHVKDAKASFERACRMGSGNGCAALAEITQAAGDRQAAVRWWKRACESGFPAACAREAGPRP